MVDVCLNVFLVSLGECNLREHQTYGLVIDEIQMLEHWRLGRKSRVRSATVCAPVDDDKINVEDMAFLNMSRQRKNDCESHILKQARHWSTALGRICTSARGGLTRPKCRSRGI